jgi:hypothetical protein
LTYKLEKAYPGMDILLVLAKMVCELPDPVG